MHDRFKQLPKGYETLGTVDRAQIEPNLQKVTYQCGCKFLTSMQANYRSGERQTVISRQDICFGHSLFNPFNQ